MGSCRERTRGLQSSGTWLIAGLRRPAAQPGHELDLRCDERMLDLEYGRGAVLLMAARQPGDPQHSWCRGSLRGPVPHGQTRLDADTDDVHRLLDRLTDKPAMVFDSHSGAIVVLELLSARIDGGLDRVVEWSGTLGACAAAVGGVRGQRFDPLLILGDAVRGVIVRFLVIVAVLGGVVFAGAGVAVADQGRSVGGDNSSAPPCGASDIDFAQGCFFGWGRFFQ
jgi:hypothetical protein